MDPKIVQSISKKVYKKFPEVDGKKPRVRKQKTPKGNGAGREGNYLLIFRGSGKGPGGKTIPRLVRVVTSAKGKIIKISTSRG